MCWPCPLLGGGDEPQIHPVTTSGILVVTNTLWTKNLPGSPWPLPSSECPRNKEGQLPFPSVREDSWKTANWCHYSLVADAPLQGPAQLSNKNVQDSICNQFVTTAIVHSVVPQGKHVKTNTHARSKTKGTRRQHTYAQNFGRALGLSLALAKKCRCHLTSYKAHSLFHGNPMVIWATWVWSISKVTRKHLLNLPNTRASPSTTYPSTCSYVYKGDSLWNAASYFRNKFSISKWACLLLSLHCLTLFLKCPMLGRLSS